MNTLAEFIKSKIKQSKPPHPALADISRPVNMTGVLSHPRNILIIPYNRLGTVLLATRMFRSIRDQYPSARISVAVHESLGVLIHNDPAIDEIIPFGDEIENPNSREFQAYGRKLAKRKFDMSLFLSYQFDRGMAYLSHLSEATLRVSFSISNDLEYFNVEIVPAKGIRYEVERYSEMLRTIGIASRIRDYTMTISDQIREKARLRFLPAGPTTGIGTLIGFDLTRETAGDPLSPRIAESVLKSFITDLGATVAVFFEPGKTQMAAELKETFGKDIILVEDRPISLMAGLMSYCRCIVAHNTDLLQLAIAVNIPTVAVLTPHEMVQWSPGEGDRLIHLERSDSTWPASSRLSDAIRGKYLSKSQG